MRPLEQIISEGVDVKVEGITVEDAATERPLKGVEELKRGTEFIVHISPDFPDMKVEMSKMYATFRYRVRDDLTVEQQSFVPSFENVKPLVDTGRWVTKLSRFGPQIADAITGALKAR